MNNRNGKVSLFFYGLLMGESDFTFAKRKEACDDIQKSYLACFEKYFLLATLLHPDDRFVVKLPKNAQLMGFPKHYVVKDELSHLKKPMYITEKDE